MTTTDTVYLDEQDSAVVIIDQTQLPNTYETLRLTTLSDMQDAIYRLKVRGAPAIGVAAALCAYVLMARSELSDMEALYRAFDENASALAATRPTAVNLTWALSRMAAVKNRMMADAATTREAFLQALHDEAVGIYEEDIAVCRCIGEHGLSLLSDGCGILTHCNAGRLATVRYGTATAPLYLAHERGMSLHVYCDETRPLLQGARLTAYELAEAGLDVTLLCDNMSASLMKQKKVNIIFVGCDRVAANGDVANKIGTSVVATVAARYHVPFYVCAPTSTIDLATPDGDAIVIEQRSPEEVTTMWYAARMAPEGIKVYNPAFDVTDASAITGIITEYGIARPPYDKSLRTMVAQRDAQTPSFATGEQHA